MRPKTIRVSHTLAMVLVGTVAAAVVAMAQAPTGPIMRLTATTENVSGAGDAIRFDVLRWSTDAERDQLLGAWTLTTPAAAPGGRGGPARGGDTAAAAGAAG